MTQRTPTVLLFDVVLSRAAGFVAGGALLAVIAVAWVALPRAIARRADEDPTRTTR